MIIIPMLGRSMRFKNAGYTKPKYELLLGNQTLFAATVSSFVHYFTTDRFYFIVRDETHVIDFVATELDTLGVLDYEIIPLCQETKGQADTVFHVARNLDEEQPITIFNIDTIRKNFLYPEKNKIADGYLEVFKGSGNQWSFVDPSDNFKVLRTTEKERISDLCSDGLYHFSRTSSFLWSFQEECKSKHGQDGELYVAPLYNHLIEADYDIRYVVVDSDQIINCGTPQDYEREVRLRAANNARPATR